MGSRVVAVGLAVLGTSAVVVTSAVARRDPKAAAEVPQHIRTRGTLIVASDATYAPDEFVSANGRGVVGMDADLAHAIGEALGLHVKVVNATFDTIIPGLRSGKYDLGMSSFTDTKARQKVVDFVTYFSAGTSFYTKAIGGTAVTGLGSLCGLTVSLENGTTEQADAVAQSARCKRAGKRAVAVLAFPDQNSANLAIASGRAQVGMADSPVASYIVKRSKGQFKLTGTSYGTAPYGIAIPKGNGMARPVLDAVKVLMRDGSYAAILRRWGVAEGAISDPQINGATG